MAVRKVLLYPDPILEEVCEPVTTFDKKLGKLLDDMYETMMAYDGVGLAAPQIGIRKQIAVVYADDETGKIELINPQILEAGGEQTDVEGCLSFPGLYGEVSRPYYVKVRAQNRKGKFFVLEAEDFLARVIQHELDHLQGILFTSKVVRYVDEEELAEGAE
ncbi:MAG: peptide deformylase [Bacillales bacterium]